MRVLALTLFAALLFMGAVFYSFGSMRNGASSHELEKEKLRQEIALLNLNTSSSAPVNNYAVEPIEETEEELAALKAELAAVKAEQQLEQAQQEILNPEPIVPEIDPGTEERLQRRARQVNNAMLMGIVNQYYPADGFVSINISNPNNVVQGARLAIRRNTGIVGHLEVTTVEGAEAIADVLATTFLAGEIDIQSGDELILPPL